MTHFIYITIICIMGLPIYWCFTQYIDPKKLQSWLDFSLKQKEYRDARAKALRDVELKYGKVVRVTKTITK